MMHVLHVLYSSLPSSKGGDIRSRDIVQAQRSIGLDVSVVSSPFQPPQCEGVTQEVIGGVVYHRTFDASAGLSISEKDRGLLYKLKKVIQIVPFIRTVTTLARSAKVDVIHGHSTFFCGFSAWVASRVVGASCVYEVRSLWEQRSAMTNPSLKSRIVAWGIKSVETLTMKLADHVVVISQGLKRDILSRGIPENKISVIGNAVALESIKDSGTSLSGKDPEKVVFAYVGNVSEIEGLDLLIEAVRELRREGWRNVIRIYGGGPALESLKQIANGVEGVEFLGSFSPVDVESVYAQIDVVVNPRKRSPLTDKVTPLKPLEAMGHRKLVLVSNVEGMLELVRDGETGVVAEADDSSALAKKLRYISDNAERLIPTVTAAYDFVEKNRSWRSNARNYELIYERL